MRQPGGHRRFLAGVLLALFAVAPMIAQETGTGAPEPAGLTVEERYLASHTTVATLNAQLRTDDEELKLLALAGMEDQFRAGVLARDDRTAFEALAYVLDEGVTHVTKGDAMPLHYYPEVRRRAAEIISWSTQDGVVSQLVTNVLKDPEPNVQAQALYSLARIGADPEGDVSRAIAKRLLREDLDNPDLGVVYAALVALENIYADEDNPLQPEAREMVMRVSTGGPYTKLIRHKALAILGTM